MSSIKHQLVSQIKRRLLHFRVLFRSHEEYYLGKRHGLDPGIVFKMAIVFTTVANQERSFTIDVVSGMYIVQIVRV